MMNRIQGKEFQVLLPVLLITNVIQSIFTPISRDEAYYWMFSKNLDWGYFDHPPMVALFIYSGSMIFKGTLGVRLLTAIFSFLTLIITWKLVPEEYRKLKNTPFIFLLVAFSMPVLNIYGFITTPDVPLLFFSALYLYVFQQFTRRSNLMNALMLGTVAALLMYSKYHGAFLILFSFLPNLRLLRNPFFYLAALLGLALYTPHIIWQFQHDFISFRYHLYQRTDGFMGGKHIVDYILNAFVILNPFLLGLYLYMRFVRKDRTEFPPFLTYVFWGFIIFFGLTSFRDHIEPQWIGVAAIPLVVFLVGQFARMGITVYLKTFVAISIGLIIVLRLLLLLPLDLETEFHTYKAGFYETMRDKAGSSRVMFINSYADASKYSFYTGDTAFTYNCYDYRKNQFDIWDFEKSYHRQDVFFITGEPYPWTDSSLHIDGKVLYYKGILRFPMYNKVSGDFLSIQTTAPLHKIHTVAFTVRNPYDYPIVLNDTFNPVSFFLVYQTCRKRYLTRLGTEGPDAIGPGEEVALKGYYYPVHPPGEYQLAVGLQPGRMSPLLITDKINVSLQQ